jgi:hypothetical protein
MRLSLGLFICLLYLQLPVYSFGRAQADKRVTLSGTYTLHNVFLEIEKQTGKQVYYINTVLDDEQKVTIDLKNSSLKEALQQILNNRNLEWSVEEKVISIRKSRNNSPGKRHKNGKHHPNRWNLHVKKYSTKRFAANK